MGRNRKQTMKPGGESRRWGGKGDAAIDWLPVMELTGQVEQEKKHNQSEVERWNGGKQLRNRVGKRTSESHTAGRRNISLLARSVRFPNLRRGRRRKRTGSTNRKFGGDEACARDILINESNQRETSRGRRKWYIKRGRAKKEQMTDRWRKDSKREKSRKEEIKKQKVEDIFRPIRLFCEFDEMNFDVKFETASSGRLLA